MESKQYILFLVPRVKNVKHCTILLIEVRLISLKDEVLFTKKYSGVK